MPLFVSTRDETRNMDEITSDFSCLKVSALRKTSRITENVHEVTIGPHCTPYAENSLQVENIENEQNNCNIRDVRKTDNPAHPKVSSRGGLNFSIKKILLENELQRREEVRQTMQYHVQRMDESERDLQKKMAIFRATMAIERNRREQEKAERLAKEEAREESLAQQSEMRWKHEQQVIAQRSVERKKKMEHEAEEQRRKNREKRELIDRMVPFQTSFRAKYQDISSLSKSCKDRNAAGPALAPHATKFKELSQRMEGLVEKAKLGELTEADLNTADVLIRQSEDILNAFRSEIERINASYDAEIARREEEVRQAQIHAQLEAAKAQEAQNFQLASQPTHEKPVDQTETDGIIAKENELTVEQVAGEIRAQEKPIVSDIISVPKVVESSSIAPSAPPSEQSDLHEFVDRESLTFYLNRQQLLEAYTSSYQQLLQSEATKKFRFECQKAINIPVNAISAVSGEHLKDKYERLQQLLDGKGPSNVAQNLQGILFCKDTLAKKLVEQGETLVSSKPEAAFPVAAVAVALWNDHPDFGDLLLAHFHRTCPYTVPIFVPRQEGQSNEDYYRSLGYKYSEDGTVEKQDKFLKRMSGLLRLYASLMVTRQRRNETRAHPHGVQNAWRWLAAIMNIEPRPDVCATLILDMLEVAGSTLWTVYPRQFPKLLKLLVIEYYPRMKNVGGTGGGPMARLEEFLKKCLSKGFIPPPDGQLAPNFW